MHDLKYKIYFYTEGEFLEMLEEIVNATSKDKSLKGKKLEKYLDTLVDHFIKITEHPKKGDLIFYPNSQEDGEPENILKIVKECQPSRGAFAINPCFIRVWLPVENCAINSGY
ncbi:colicin immunity protein [Escherichia coli]|nr:bacteriocin immunity protein [Escherichia coli]EYB45095.1 colicin immunity protein [Escherichia coli]